MYQPTSFGLNTSSMNHFYNTQQRHGSIDYSQKSASYQPFVGFHEASFTDHQQSSPFHPYEDYHPLEKRRLSYLPSSPAYPMDWYTSSPPPMMYAPMDMYTTTSSPYLSCYNTIPQGIIRDRAPSSSSSSSDSSYVDSPPASRRTSTATTKVVKPRSSRKVSNCPAVDSDQKMFACTYDGCEKVFKRSEHLKRHIRSIHTLEKRKSF